MKRSKYLAISIIQILSLCSCGAEIDCDIEDEHFHYYRTMSGIERLIGGEYEYVGEYERCDEYVLATSEYQDIVANHLCILDDNLEYVKRRFDERPENKRLELIREYIPEHYGMKYTSGEDGEMGSFVWGVIPESFNEHWKDISIDEYTNNPVKDVTYGILLYRIMDDGTLESKAFKDLEAREEEYVYFKTGTLITEIMGDEYYLDSNKKKVRVSE